MPKLEKQLKLTIGITHTPMQLKGIELLVDWVVSIPSYVGDIKFCTEELYDTLHTFVMHVLSICFAFRYIHLRN